MSTSSGSEVIAPHLESSGVVTTERNHVEEGATTKRAHIIEPRDDLMSAGRGHFRAQRAELRRLHDLTRDVLSFVLR